MWIYFEKQFSSKNRISQNIIILHIYLFCFYLIICMWLVFALHLFHCLIFHYLFNEFTIFTIFEHCTETNIVTLIIVVFHDFLWIHKLFLFYVSIDKCIYFTQVRITGGLPLFLLAFLFFYLLFYLCIFTYLLLVPG
jgi:hypothetical protein